MTDYRAFEEMARQWRAASGVKNRIVLIDMSAGSLDRLLGFVMQARRFLATDVLLHLYWFCPHGQLPDPPDGFGTRWVPDLPGLHRLTSASTNLVLTIGIGQALEMVRDLVVRADVVLVRDLDQPVDCPLSARALACQPDQHAVRTLRPAATRADAQDVWLDPVGVVQPGRVAVVGAGIAGMTLAAVLAQRGLSVTVLDPHLPAMHCSVHHGHHAAALTPVVSSDDNIRSQLSRAGALHADRLWRTLPQAVGQRCGALQLQKMPNERRQVDLQEVASELGLPDWASFVSARQASDIAGQRLSRGGLWLPGGWVIRVPRLLSELAATDGLSLCQAKVDRIDRSGGCWRLTDADGVVLASAAAVVLANAADAPALLARSAISVPATGNSPGLRRLCGMHRLAGEISLIPAAAIDQGPRCIVGGDGYVLPSIDGWCVSGGTYVRDAEQAICSPEGQRINLDRAARLLDRADLPAKFSDARSLPAWAGWRAVVPGRLPVIGPIAAQPGLFLATAGASRGLTWSVMQATLIADLLQAMPPVLGRKLLSSIASEM